MDKVYSGLVDENGNKILTRYYSLSNITEEDKKELFKNVSIFSKYCVIVDEYWNDKGHRITEKWGQLNMELYDNGEAISQNMSFFPTLKDAQEYCELISKITNKDYRNWFIVER